MNSQPIFARTRMLIGMTGMIILIHFPPVMAQILPATSVFAVDMSFHEPNGFDKRLLIVDKGGILWQTGNLEDVKKNHTAQSASNRQDDKPDPVQAYPIRNHVKSVSALYAVFIIDDNDILWGWGKTANGQLLISTDSNIVIPEKDPIKILTDVQSVLGNDYTVLAIRKDNTLWAWGHSSTLREDNLPGPLNRPRKILDHVVTVVNSDNHAVALKEDGTLWTWGNNECGGLGNGHSGYENYRPTPMDMGLFGGKRILSIAARSNENIVLTENNTLWYWGNDNGYKPYCMNEPVSLPEPLKKKIPEKLEKLVYEKTYLWGGALYALDTGHTLYYMASVNPDPSYDIDVTKIDKNVSEVISTTDWLAILKKDGTVCIKKYPHTNEPFISVHFVQPKQNDHDYK